MTWISLLTQKELEDRISPVETFDFGEINYHFFKDILSELNNLKTQVDDVVALLEFLFLQGSESQQADMFLRFIAANLAKDKIVVFYDDESGSSISGNG